MKLDRTEVCMMVYTVCPRKTAALRVS